MIHDLSFRRGSLQWQWISTVVCSHYGLTTLPSMKVAGPFGVSPMAFLISLSRHGSSSNTHFSLPP